MDGRARACPWARWSPAACAGGRAGARGVGSRQQRARRSGVASRGPHRCTRPEATTSGAAGGAAMRAETRPRPGQAAAGSRHEPGGVRQTAPAAGEPLAPPPQPWLAAVLRRAPRVAAVRRVQANQGAPGGDGMRVAARPAALRQAGPEMRAPRLSATDVPAPVRAGDGPMPGGGTHRRGMRTARDRLRAQALGPVLVPLCDPACAARREGFRPGRSAHPAREQACRALADGDRGVGHLARAHVCASVQPALVMSRGARQVKATRRVRGIRRALNAGSMHEGLVRPRDVGRPPGAPRSPR